MYVCQWWNSRSNAIVISISYRNVYRQTNALDEMGEGVDRFHMSTPRFRSVCSTSTRPHTRQQERRPEHCELTPMHVQDKKPLLIAVTPKLIFFNSGQCVFAILSPPVCLSVSLK
jgi:hypothetical protein